MLDAGPLAAACEEIAVLRRALAGTAEEPRPFAEIKMPFKLGRLLSGKAVANMRPAAVLIAITQTTTGAGILLTRRSESLRQHKGQISFPGGSRDPGDASFVAAALREAEEEVGLPPAQVEVVGFLDDYPTLTGFRITPVVGLVHGNFMPRIDPGEVAELFEMPLARVTGRDSFERKILSRDGLNVPFFEINFGGHRIWGATAGILWELRNRLIVHG